MPMAASIASSGPALVGPVAAKPTRVLCLGNELIADDALGVVAARRLARRLGVAGTPVPPGSSFDPALTVWAFELPGVGMVEIVETALTGMYLLEAVVGASRLIVLDTVVSGAVDPGTILELTERDLAGPRGGSPHYIGLLETLDLARALGMQVPDEVVIVAVEAGDYMTVGGEMTRPVEAAVPVVVDRAMALIASHQEAAVHEAGLADRLYGIVTARALQAGARRIVAVNLEAGILAGVSEEALRFHWEQHAKGTPADGAELTLTLTDPPTDLRLVSIDVPDDGGEPAPQPAAGPARRRWRRVGPTASREGGTDAWRRRRRVR